ncbi:unnamed protein product [Somion occarium]|uniref:Uncharacterized protein n=1 Tax=Somion occarium TaxID=3059160 RepID=A0ABP1CLM7_9APHY
MQHSSDLSDTSHENRAVMDWMRLSRVENSIFRQNSWDSHVAQLLSEHSFSSRASTSYQSEDNAIPVEYTWTPPTPTLDSDQSSSRRSSLQSIPTSEYFDELPEIPFISAAIPLDQCLDEEDVSLQDDNVSERTFWSNLIRPSRVRTTSERSLALLGETNHRVLSPTRCRAPSVSSNASSRSKPAPAKSILSSSSSIRTRTGRSPPSVKFLDMPTIHYEDEHENEYNYADESDDDDDNDDEQYDPSPAGPEEKKWPFGFIRRLVGLNPSRKPPVSTSGRPVISGPYLLWDPPRPQARLGGPPTNKRRAASLRSVRSNNSLRSIRSCSSRFQSYWTWLSGKDP